MGRKPVQTSLCRYIYQIIQLEQMSKITSQLQHTRRIQNNLQTIQKQQQHQSKQTYLRLKNKMQGHDKNRQKKNQEKLKSYKLNDQKWNKKIQSIERKFRSQNRQAMQKAEKYRQESEDYFKNKQSQVNSARGTSYQKFNMNKTQKLLTRFNDLSFHQNQSRQKNHKHNKYLQFKMETLGNVDSSALSHPQSSRGQLKNSRTININEQIIKHKQKSSFLQKQKQSIVFQNAMKRLEKIQQTRKKAQKLKQKQKSPIQIRKPKKQRHQQQQSYDFYYKNNSNKKNSSPGLSITKSKQSLLSDSIQNHLKAKQIIQQKQFKQRQKIIENQLKRKKQDKIMKIIKNKIKDIKTDAIKSQMLQ